MNKIVKTRKIHLCKQCGKKINIGESALYVEKRLPTYEVNPNKHWRDIEQVGIEYYKYYVHIECMEKIDWKILQEEQNKS